MIKYLLFDLGKVLYDIDIPRMIANYNAMIPDGQDRLTFSMEGQHEMFSLLEIGQIDAMAFARGMKSAYGFQASEQDILNAWNSLLVGVIPGRVEAIQQLATRYPIALLSNTNAFHYQAYKEETKALFAPMEAVFLSHELGLRKPDPLIYTTVLDRLGWEAKHTLFVDDGIKNTEVAQSLGIQTVLYQEEADFETLMTRLMC